MSPKRELAPIQVPATASLPTEQAKDSREVLRSRQLIMKPHDRARARINKRGSKAFRGERDAPRKPFKLDQEDLGLDTYSPVKEVADDPIQAAEHHEPVEVPLLTIIRSSKPWDGVGADFELVSNPGDVIALDEEIDYSDDEWEAVDDFDTKAKVSRTSYAAAVKTGRKAN